MSQNTKITTIPADDDTDASPCSAKLCEVSGRDRTLAIRLREQAAQLLKLAELAEINAAIGANAAAGLIGEA